MTSSEPTAPPTTTTTTPTTLPTTTPTTTTTTTLRPLQTLAIVASTLIATTVGFGALPAAPPLAVEVIAGALELLAAATFLRWLWCASSNLHAHSSTTPEHTPRACVVWWFVPFANLLVPAQAVHELARLSKTAAEQRWSSSSPWFVGAWWSAWLAAQVVTAVCGGRDAIAARAVVVVVNAVAAALCITVIAAITRWQHRAFRRP